MTGFTGSAIWHLLYSFPPNDSEEIERGYEDFAKRWSHMIDVTIAAATPYPCSKRPHQQRPLARAGEVDVTSTST